MQPMMKTTVELNTIAHTGTSSDGCMRPMCRDRMSPLSRAKAQVSRDAVSWPAVREKSVMKTMTKTKTMAAASERVLCR